MKKSLPPLNALRVFESAARHSSFKLAANELHVTHGAVSHQITALEEWLQLSLFKRLNRQVVLTAEGQALLNEIAPALERISLAVTSLTKQRDAVTLKVNAGHTFFTNWLIPRLPRFYVKNPDISIQITTSIEPIDFLSSDFDVAIRRRPQSRGGVQETPFLPGMMSPICAPHVARSLEKLESIEKHMLLHSRSTPNAWGQWSATADWNGQRNCRALVLDEVGMCIEGAKSGLGLAIVPLYLVADDVLSGTLTFPFGQIIQPNYHFRSFHTPGRGTSDAVEAFVTWLKEEGDLAVAVDLPIRLPENPFE